MGIAAAALLCTLAVRPARADDVDANVALLAPGKTYKQRLGATLALSRSRDPRAVIGLADALEHDADPTIRRVSALALGKMIDAQTAPDARELAFASLDKAIAADRDASVRETAKDAMAGLRGLRGAVAGRRAVPGAADAKGAAAKASAPAVFVAVDTFLDKATGKGAPTDVVGRVTSLVRRKVETTGYATTWPGGPPSAAQLAASHARGFMIASTVKKIAVRKLSAQAEVSCTVAIQVAPWEGSDGHERWEAHQSASASGSAKAMTANNDREIQSGVRDCVEAVAEDVTARKVMPFLKQLASAGS